MAAEQDGIVADLNKLIEACKDREQGYRTAAEAACNQDLKTLLHSYERQSAEFVAELRAEVERLGGTPAETGSVAGWLTRGWQHLTAIIAGGDDAAVIIGCGHGEDAARAAYEAVLAGPLPPEVRAVIERQYAGEGGPRSPARPRGRRRGARMTPFPAGRVPAAGTFRDQGDATWPRNCKANGRAG